MLWLRTWRTGYDPRRRIERDPFLGGIRPGCQCRAFHQGTIRHDPTARIPNMPTLKQGSGLQIQEAESAVPARTYVSSSG
jgi:hypothetical protein